MNIYFLPLSEEVVENDIDCVSPSYGKLGRADEEIDRNIANGGEGRGRGGAESREGEREGESREGSTRKQVTMETEQSALVGSPVATCHAINATVATCYYSKSKGGKLVRFQFRLAEERRDESVSNEMNI